MNRRQFIVGIVGSSALVALDEMQEVRAETLEYGSPTFEVSDPYDPNGVTTEATYDHDCNPPEKCFNDNNGKCWYQDGASCSWYNNSATCYINVRCAYKKYDKWGFFVKKFCDTKSSTCRRKCYLC